MRKNIFRGDRIQSSPAIPLVLNVLNVSLQHNTDVEDSKMHAKQHISDDMQGQHLKCNVCSKVFRNKAELKMHIESVCNNECESLTKVFRNQLEFNKHVDNVHIFRDKNQVWRIQEQFRSRKSWIEQRKSHCYLLK